MMLESVSFWYLPNTVFLIFIACFFARTSSKWRFAIAYILFFITPAFTYAGLLGPLTGFDGAGNTTYFGLSFLAPFLAMMLISKPERIRRNPVRFFIAAINPAYMTCGPIPSSERMRVSFVWRNGWRRLRVLYRDFVISVFFIFVIAPSFGSMLLLKTSTQPFDVLVFGAFFEGYVYFNFAGYAMLAWSAMKLFGVDVQRNFSAPFGSRSVVEYWKNWHKSLGYVLREIFFRPSKPFIGANAAAALTFMASALWHGVTANFMLWGAFHATCWMTSHWLYERRWHTACQVFLLLFSIVIGRVLFAEADVEFLFIKLAALFNRAEWAGEMMVGGLMSSLAIKKQVFLLVGVVLIVVEMACAKNPAAIRNGAHLKNPWVLGLMCLCTGLFGVSEGAGALYGQR